MKYVLCPLALCSMLLCQGVWSEEPDNALFTYCAHTRWLTRLV